MSRFLAKRLHKLAPYVPGEQPQGKQQLIKLNTNENPYPPGEKVKAALLQEDSDDLRLYPNPDATALLNAAAGVFGLSSEQVIVGNGSDEILAFCFQAFCDNGAAFPDITYGFYHVWADLYGVNYQTMPLTDDFSFNIKDYEGRSETLFIANPNAPTGKTITNAEIETLLRSDANRLVIIDEAYADFAASNALSLIDKYDNLLIIRTMSKGYSLAGARIGFALGNAELIADLARIKYSFNPYNLNRLSSLIGEIALLDQDYFKSCRDKVIKSREQLSAELSRLGFDVLASEANFIFAGKHPQLSAQEYMQALRERNILVRYFEAKRIADYLRISIGTQEEIEQLINSTKEILHAKNKTK